MIIILLHPVTLLPQSQWRQRQPDMSSASAVQPAAELCLRSNWVLFWVLTQIQSQSPRTPDQPPSPCAVSSESCMRRPLSPPLRTQRCVYLHVCVCMCATVRVFVCACVFLCRNKEWPPCIKPLHQSTGAQTAQSRRYSLVLLPIPPQTQCRTCSSPLSAARTSVMFPCSVLPPPLYPGLLRAPGALPSPLPRSLPSGFLVEDLLRLTQPASYTPRSLSSSSPVDMLPLSPGPGAPCPRTLQGSSSPGSPQTLSPDSGFLKFGVSAILAPSTRSGEWSLSAEWLIISIWLITQQCVE